MRKAVRKLHNPIQGDSRTGQPDPGFLHARLDRCLPHRLEQNTGRAAGQPAQTVQFRRADAFRRAPFMSMISVPKALERLGRNSKVLVGSETLALRQCLGRVLASDIVSEIDVPPADNSAMDGYALCL